MPTTAGNRRVGKMDLEHRDSGGRAKDLEVALRGLFCKKESGIIRTLYISSENHLSGRQQFFDEQAGNDQSPFAWRSVCLCVSLMSHVLVLIRSTSSCTLFFVH